MKKLTCLVFAYCMFLVKRSFQCGYESCPRTDLNAINVHVVCHSHYELGWLKTIKEYYYDEVKHILNSVVVALKNDPRRRFTQAEAAFFNMWYHEQPPDVCRDVKKLINDGQLEIAGGGWSIIDEATTHYQSIIDQYTFGLKFLNDTFGKCSQPKTSWQHNAFGHSKGVAKILAQMGYDGHFISRIDYRDYQERVTKKETEFIWFNNVDEFWLFTSLIFNGSGPPTGLCFDASCTDFIYESNRVNKAQLFLKAIHEQAKHYTTNNILISMGSSFQYQQAEETFKSIDTLISSKNIAAKNKRVQVFYSTPACYIKAVHESAAARRVKFPSKTDDFYPYTDSVFSYWTGFYSSRPALKRMERDGNNLLQVTKQLFSFIPTSLENPREIYDLSKAVATLQHHEALTGTQKLYVAKDYMTIISSAMKKSISGCNVKLQQIINKSPTNLHITFDSCLMLNASRCDKTRGDTFLVILYNPLAWNVSHYVRLPVEGEDYTIRTSDDDDVPFQVTKHISHFKKFSNIAAHDLIFYAKDIPALGFKMYHIAANTFIKLRNPVRKNNYKLQNDMISLELNKSGHVRSLTMNNVTTTFKQELFYYSSFQTTNVKKERNSGAYIFQPTNQAKAIGISSHSVTRGDLFDEVYQEYTSWARQYIRVYKHKNYVEFDWIVGPIHTRDRRGKEVIARYETRLNSGDVFYTDINGRDEIKRVRNFRKTYPFTGDGMVAGNYYPVVSKISLEDSAKKLKFSVLTDRPHGGSSLLTGQVELMLHRSMVMDDNIGVDEPLQDYEVEHGALARGQHHVIFGAKDVLDERKMVIEKHLQPWIFIADISRNTRREFETLQLYLEFEFSALHKKFPENVHILTLEPWNILQQKYLIRLECIKNKFSADIIVNMKEAFSVFEVIELTEMTLSGIRPLQGRRRYSWTSKEFGTLQDQHGVDAKLKDFKVGLKPGEIRTFIAKMELKGPPQD